MDGGLVERIEKLEQWAESHDALGAFDAHPALAVKQFGEKIRKLGSSMLDEAGSGEFLLFCGLAYERDPMGDSCGVFASKEEAESKGEKFIKGGKEYYYSVLDLSDA